ncbi:histidine phosphatase family protein [Streptomyces physcomitrii]|uniref:Histidine phosphatase family protein n=1 Tax=Streptomyces physcomitrii TaxID=2724184 RepID=A0ABX1H3P2_9ACTN|nr:histidine phosphatase family protein [Streptomyces physcomitrii]NKI42988.1 histidine phosphatase family protein [Streptomyces physcomitrii]
MSVLLLVRHGQASFGAADYDALSETGYEQSRLLGAALARRGITPAAVLRGGMKRHEQTVAGLLDGARWQLPPAQVDADWDEFDGDGVLEVLRPEFRDRSVLANHLAAAEHPGRAFQAFFEQATDRWRAGAHEGEYAESFRAFGSRVEAALGRAALLPGTVLVVTSGGPLATVVSRLLAGDDSLWGRLNPVMANSAVTKVVSGSRGMTCVSFNAHEHLEHDRELLTYR